MTERELHTISTHVGVAFDFSNPTAEQIVVEDIAQALSNICRYGGHVERPYSVAQHAVFVRDLVIQAGHPELGFAALHHDSHEAYIGDMPTPLKVMVGEEYATIQDTVNRVVAEALNIDVVDFTHDVVKAADYRALEIEGVQLKSGTGSLLFARALDISPHIQDGDPIITPLMSYDAKREFLWAHDYEVRKRREPAYT